MNTPVVSIVIPTYNRASLLPRALDSIIAQTMTEWEIILVDDGSTDATQEVVLRYRAQLADRFVIIRQINQGSSAARNHGIERARGRYVAFLDSDDEFMPTKLKRQADLLERRNDLGMVFSDYSYIDLDGNRHSSMLAPFSPRMQGLIAERIGSSEAVFVENVFDELLKGYFMATIVGMVRRDILGDTIRFPVGFAYAEEWHFYLKVVRAARVGYIDEPLCLHHHVRGSLSRSDEVKNTEALRVLLDFMRRDLEPLTRRQRRILDDHWARACRQCGYDAYRMGDFKEASRWFRVAFGAGPSWHVAKSYITSKYHSLRVARPHTTASTP